MPVNKKAFQEKLQETRSKVHDKIRYRRRKQEEDEINKYLNEELKQLMKENKDVSI